MTKNKKNTREPIVQISFRKIRLDNMVDSAKMPAHLNINGYYDRHLTLAELKKAVETGKVSTQDSKICTLTMPQISILARQLSDLDAWAGERTGVTNFKIELKHTKTTDTDTTLEFKEQEFEKFEDLVASLRRLGYRPAGEDKDLHTKSLIAKLERSYPVTLAISDPKDIKSDKIENLCYQYEKENVPLIPDVELDTDVVVHEGSNLMRGKAYKVYTITLLSGCMLVVGVKEKIK